MPPLTPDRKIHVRQHLMGNLLNAPVQDIKKRAKDITNILNTTGFSPDKKIAMSAYIDYQVVHVNKKFSDEIKQFETECQDTISTFNQEYLELMKAIDAAN